MLADTKLLLQRAQRGNYAVGHFNINNMEIVQGIVKAAEKLKSPIILAASEGAIEYAGLNYLYNLALIASENSKIPIALHLDHGKNPEIIRKCINWGFSSVMIDASHESFEKNIKLTSEVVKFAHSRGVSVEAELGTIGGKEDKVKGIGIAYTDPQKAKEFVQKTGCDFLAVAIGTSHGAYKFSGEAKLKIDLLRKIQEKVKIPLVLHGASGVPDSLVNLAKKYGAELSGVKGIPDAQIRQAINNGICKINTDTDLRIAFDAAVRRFVKEHPKDIDPRHILDPAREMIAQVVEQRIKLFKSNGKA